MNNYTHQKNGRGYIYDIDPTETNGFCMTPNSVMSFLSLGRNEVMSEFELIMFIIFQCSLTKGIYRRGNSQIKLAKNEAAISLTLLATKSKWKAGRVRRFIDKVVISNVLTKRIETVGNLKFTVFGLVMTKSMAVSTTSEVGNYTDNQLVKCAQNRAQKPAKKHGSAQHINTLINTLEDFSKFDDSQLALDVWMDWLEYKKTQFKFKYKSKKSQTVGIQGFYKKSKGCAQIAKAMVERTIENTWKGLIEFDEKDLTKLMQQNIKSGKIVSINKETELERFAEVYPEGEYDIAKLRKFLKCDIFKNKKQKDYYFNSFAPLKGSTSKTLPTDLKPYYDAVKKLYYDFIALDKKVA